jgi:hypothetical protein
MPRKLNPVTSAKNLPRIGRMRYAYTFTLSSDANARLERLCRALNRTRSIVIEGFLLPDYTELFRLFREGTDFGSVVEQTHQSPDIVRQARLEWESGWKAPVPVEIKALDKKIQIKELEVDQTMIERSSEERVERLRAETEKRRLDQELRIERTRAVSNSGGKR